MPFDPGRVQAVFRAAIESDSDADRTAVLDRECSTDKEIRRQVDALLAAYDQPDNFLDPPILRPANIRVEPPSRPKDHGRDFTDCDPTSGAPDRSDPTIDWGPVDATMGVDAMMGVDATMGRARPVPVIPDYEILEELGRGGMGVVYKARQVRLGRPCALKMILGGAHASPAASARFLAEARAIAQLHHPHIIQIHHIGEADGLPFFELEYVEGGSLDKELDGTPWPARRAAGLVELLAGAVAEAHRMGIVHRDLKPGNVLLTEDGSPKITDFGLAKSLDSDVGLTATDSIMGSPSYMAPEQAAGLTERIGPPADIHALGATLYMLLTGRPPFRGSTIMETLEQVKLVEPVPPSRLVHGLSRDIETIALKCLQKEPEKRYGSAAGLAEDLRRFLDGSPIEARPVPPWDRAWRWCRRHPAPASLTVAVVLVSVLGLAGILWQWNEAVGAQKLATRRAVAEAEARRETESILVDMYTTNGIIAGDRGDHARAALWFANAARRAESDPGRRLANAIRAETWGRLAFTPLRAVVADGAWPGVHAFHPGGRHLIAETVLDGPTRESARTLWDLEAERSLSFPGGSKSATAAAWSPDGRALAAGFAEGGVIVAPFPEGKAVDRIEFPGRIHLLIYSADGRYLAIAGGNVARVWDVQARAFATPELVHDEAVTSLAFHPEGRSLATGSRDGLARLFAISEDEDARPLWPPVPHRFEEASTFFPTFSAAPVFVDGGRGLITHGDLSRLTWRSVETGAEVQTREFPDMTRGIAAIETGPDGRYLAVVGTQIRKVELIEAVTGRSAAPPLEHENTVMRAAFSPDGRTLLTGSTDSTARLWSVPGGKPLSRPLDLHRSVLFVAFAPGGRSLLTQDGDLIRLWGLPREGLPRTYVPLDGRGSFVALSRDGSLTIPTGMTYLSNRGLQSTRAHDVATGEPVGPPLRPGGDVLDAAFAPDGKSVATLGTGGDSATDGPNLIVWDWASGRRVWRKPLPSEPRSLCYRPDGHRLAVLCEGGEILIFDPADGREVRRWHAHDAEPAHHWINNGEVRFSPDGRSLLTWGMGNDARVWDADAGQLRYSVHFRDKCHDLQFSPDGRSMALATYEGAVRVVALATGTVEADLPVHPDIVFSAAFSPDGRLLVTACRDRSIRVWDWRSGKLACPPFEHAKEAVAATFTPDGRRVISASADGSVRAWDWQSGKPVTPSLEIGGESMSLAVTPDGRHAVAGGFTNTLTILDLDALASVAVDPFALVGRVELLSGQRLHERGGAVNLSADEWLESWRGSDRRSLAEIAEPRLGPVTASGGPAGATVAGVEPPAAVSSEDVVARFNLADASLRAGRVDEARAVMRASLPLLRRAVERSPDDPSVRHRLALALVLAGDRDGYRRACDATFERFGSADDPLVGEAARACLIGSNGAIDLSAPRRLVEAALSQNPEAPWWHYVLGLGRVPRRPLRRCNLALKRFDGPRRRLAGNAAELPGAGDGEPPARPRERGPPLAGCGPRPGRRQPRAEGRHPRIDRVVGPGGVPAPAPRGRTRYSSTRASRPTRSPPIDWPPGRQTPVRVALNAETGLSIFSQLVTKQTAHCQMGVFTQPFCQERLMERTRSPRRMPRHAQSFPACLRQLLTPVVWKQARRRLIGPRRESRWLFRHLILVALAMTWSLGQSTSERSVMARGIVALCRPKRRRAGQSAAGFQKALARLSMRPRLALADAPWRRIHDQLGEAIFRPDPDVLEGPPPDPGARGLRAFRAGLGRPLAGHHASRRQAAAAAAADPGAWPPSPQEQGSPRRRLVVDQFRAEAAFGGPGLEVLPTAVGERGPVSDL